MMKCWNNNPAGVEKEPVTAEQNVLQVVKSINFVLMELQIEDVAKSII